MGPTLRRNTGHWIIAWSSPDRRSRFVCRIYWLSPSLPHFPSCFCNGFPFDRNGGICREGNSFLPPLLIRIINQNLASPPPRRRSEADMGQYMTRCADRRTDKTAADAAVRAQCARSSSSAHFFKAAGKSICVGEGEEILTGEVL